MEKSRYLHKMPRSAVFCAETDAPIENWLVFYVFALWCNYFSPIIFEECYGASGPSTSSKNVVAPVSKVCSLFELTKILYCIGYVWCW